MDLRLLLRALLLAVPLTGCFTEPDLRPVGSPPRLAAPDERSPSPFGFEPHIAPYGATERHFAPAPLAPGASESARHAQLAIERAVDALLAGDLDRAEVLAANVIAVVAATADPALDELQRHARFLRAEIALRRWMMTAHVEQGSIAAWETSVMELHLGWRVVEALFAAVDQEPWLSGSPWILAAHVRTAHLYDHLRRMLLASGCPPWLHPQDCPAFTENLRATATAARLQAERSVARALALGEATDAHPADAWLELARTLRSESPRREAAVDAP